MKDFKKLTAYTDETPVVASTGSTPNHSSELVEEAANECGHVNDVTPYSVDAKDYLIQEMLGALQNSLYFIEALEDNSIVHKFSGKARIEEVINKAKSYINGNK